MNNVMAENKQQEQQKEQKEQQEKQEKQKKELEIVKHTFAFIENFIQQILLKTPEKKDVKYDNNKQDTSVWTPSYRRHGSYGSYGSYDQRHGSYNYNDAYQFGKQVYNSIQNAFSAPAVSLSKEAPESFSQFVGDENAVQVEVQTRSGDENVVKKLGLNGLKKLGDAFELIAEDKPIDIPPLN